MVCHFEVSDAKHHLVEYTQMLDEPIPLQHLQQLGAIYGLLPTEFYIAKYNAKTVFTLLRNVVHCFDNTLANHSRTRRCNVILGMKCSGKTFLVSTLLKVISKAYPDGITLLLDGLDYNERWTTIGEQVRKAISAKGLPEVPESTDLGVLVPWLQAQKIPLLVVIDEAQCLCPLNGTTEGEIELKEAKKKTKSIVCELQTFSKEAGCLCWLTGSSQALRLVHRWEAP